jgi:hypothetical protein
MNRLLFAWLVLAAQGAGAATLNLCPAGAAPAGARVLDSALQPGGESLQLLLYPDRLAGCASLPLAQPPQWARLVGRAGARSLAAGVMLQTAQGEPRQARPQDLIAVGGEDGTAGPVPWMPGPEWLGRLQPLTFGAEERARVHSGTGGTLTLECRAGAQPAGVLLRDAAHVLPQGARLALRIEAQADAPFRVAATDEPRAQREEALTLGTLEGTRRPAMFELPAALEARHWRAWVLQCPREAARITLSSLKLAAAGAGAASSRALWIWEPGHWRQQAGQLFALLAAQRADTVYLSLPLQGEPPEIAQADVLRRFITEAGRRGLRVWAVAGDPRAVLPEERPRYAALAAALAAYNRAAPAEARLAGLQLDIEPYLNPGYAHDPEGWLAAYVDTLALLRPRAGMPLDIAVPFWWGRQRLRDGLLLDALKPLADTVTVMNYRTDPRELMAHAEPFLSWGAANGKPIRIGLEIGPIPDESLHVYRPAAAGELWLSDIGDRHAVLMLMATARTNPAGLSYSHSHSFDRSGDQTSFQRRPEVLGRLLPELEERWRAWPSFAGVALHGLDQ